MATKQHVQTIDDTDGSDADYLNLEFGLDGVTYQIDLSQTNRDRLFNALEPYVTAARRVGGRLRRGASSTGKPKSNPGEAGQMREWGRANGWNIGDRGRVPGDLIEAYRKAQADKAKPKATKPAAKSPARARRSGGAKATVAA